MHSLEILFLLAAMPRLRALLAQFAAFSAVLACASTLAADGSTRWVARAWGAPFLLPDLTPNVGLWWYFFTEMFDHFRSFFLIVFSVRFSVSRSLLPAPIHSPRVPPSRDTPHPCFPSRYCSPNAVHTHRHT
jgi:hypothetical protein